MLKEKKTKAGIIKAEAANARKEARAEMLKAAAELEKEDKYWEEAAAGISKSRGAMKREEAADKRAKAIDRRAELRLLEVEETMEIEKRLMEKKNNKKKTNDEEEDEIKKKAEDEIKKKAEDGDGKRRSRIMSLMEYQGMVDVKNTNGEIEIVEDARTIDPAILRLAIASLPEPTLTFKAFSDAKMDSLKKNKPGLNYSKRCNKIALAWKKSHLNPANRRANNDNILRKEQIRWLREEYLVEEDSSS